MFSYNIAKLLSHDLVLANNSADAHINPLIIIILIVICIFALTATVLLVCKKHKSKSKNLVQIKSTSNNFPWKRQKSIFPNMSQSMKVEELNKDLKPYGFAYYPQQDYFYSIMDGWQRDVGYCDIYDEASAALCMIIDCEPIRFNYGGKKWLIEFWKGQYGMNTGCEIGIYTTKGPSLNIPGIFDGTFYYTARDEDFMQMSFSLTKNGSLLFTRSELHWWLTGFRLGDFSYPSELVMNAKITLKNQDMCNAFIYAMLEVGYSERDLTVDGNTVSFIFDKPHAPQPLSKTPFTVNFMQTFNQRTCDAYQVATKNYPDTLDKLDLVKRDAPKMYNKIMNVSRTKELFSSYNLIKDFMTFDDNE